MEKKNFKSKFFCLALSILMFNGFALDVQADEITIPSNDDNTDMSENSGIINSSIIEGTEKENTESETKTDDGIKFEGTYDSLEDAQNKAEEKEDEYYDSGYENVKSEIEKIEDTEGKDVQIGVDFETIEDYKTKLSKEEALNLKLQLEEDESVTITISEGYDIIDYVEKDKIIERQFTTKEEALAFIQELLDEGYRVENIEFVNDTIEVSETKKFNTEEEALAFLEEFKKNHTNVEGTITPEYNEKEDVLVEENKGTEGFESKEEAEKEAEKLENSVSKDEKYYLVATVRGPEAIREENINKEFNTKQEALDYLASLEKNNYEIVSYEFTNNQEEQDRELNETFETEEEAQEKLDEFLNKYNNATGSLTAVYDKTENNAGEIIKSEEGYLTEKEAQEIADSLKIDENTDANYYVIATVTGRELVESTILNGEFESEEKAKEFIEALEAQGYEIKGFVFTANTQTDDMSLVNTYETKEEAEKALDDFKNNCDKDSVSGEITEVRDENKDTLVEENKGTEGFESKEEAEKEAEKIENSISDDEKYYIVATVRGPESLNVTEQFSESLSSEADVQAFLDSLKAQGYNIISYEFTNNQEEQDRELNETFETEEEAQEKLDEFLNKYNNATGSLTAVYDKSENVKEDEITSDNYYTNYEDALKAAEELEISEDSDLTYYVTATVVGPETTSSDLNLHGIFETEEEALDLINRLIAEGYIINDYKFINLTEVKDTKLDKTVETEKEAQEELDKFENNCDEGTVTDGNIEEVYDESGNIINSEYTTDEYYTEEEAQAKVDEEKAKTDHDYLIDGTVSNVRTDKKEINSTDFDSSLAAYEYKQSLQNQGYDISNLTIEKLVYKDGYWYTLDGVRIEQAQDTENKEFSYNHFDIAITESFKKIAANGSEEDVKGKITLTSVKVNGKSYRIPSRTTYDNMSGKYEYRMGNINVNNNTSVEISGYIVLSGTTEKIYFTMSGILNEENNICANTGSRKGFDIDFTKVSIYQEKVFIETNITEKYYIHGDATRNVYQGNLTKYQKDYDYRVTATGKETITLDAGTLEGTQTLNKYFVKTQKINKGYDYKVEANGTETVTLESGVLTGEKEKLGYYVDTKKYNKGYKYTVNATGKKTTTLDSGKISGTKELYKYFVNTQRIEKGYDYKVEATGTETVTLESGNLTAKVNKLGYYVDTKKYNKGYDFIVNVTGTKTLESGKLSADTELDIYKTVYDVDYTKAIPVYERQYFDKYKLTVTADEMEFENPKTADNGLSFIYLQIISLIGLLYSGIKLRFRK